MNFYASILRGLLSGANKKNVDHALCFAVFIINILAALARFRSYESHVGAKIALRKGKRTEEEKYRQQKQQQEEVHRLNQ